MEIDYPRKEKKVNRELQEKCTAENLTFILYKNINSKSDLFPYKVHPNKKTQAILRKKVENLLMNMFDVF